MHPVYSSQYLETVAPSHRPPVKVGWWRGAGLSVQWGHNSTGAGRSCSRRRRRRTCLHSPAHPPPSAHVQMHEKAGYYAVQGLRSVFDYFTG